jgi:hypothetical protein
MAGLAPLYGGERQFTPGVVEDHLLALRAVGIVSVREPAGDGADGLPSSYAITPYGLDKVRGAG